MDEQQLLKTVNPAGLKNVIQALEGLEDKRLTAAVLWSLSEGCGCLLGAIYPKSPMMGSSSLVHARARELEPTCWAWTPEQREELTVWGTAMALTPSEASALQAFNDSVHLAPRDRYIYVLNALKEAVGDDT